MGRLVPACEKFGLVTLDPIWDYSLTTIVVTNGKSVISSGVLTFEADHEMKHSGGTHMKFHAFALRVGFAALFCAAFTNIPVLAADCSTSALSALGVPNMTIASATVVPAAAPNPEYCDVKGSVATSGEGAEPGSANFEVMLPANWNQKFIFHGVGGLAGSLTSSANPADQALFLARGYATAITDTGHLVSNPTWEYTAPGTPDMPKIIDYFYRAVHDVTLAAKQLVKNYYHAETIRRSYFDGCSNGGKMGLIEATRFPSDYDGIISGSPWLDPVGTSLWSLKNAKALLDGYIPPAKFQAVSAAILKQCDKADGVADGLIQNPAKCAFQPDALVPETLTQKQADALKTDHEPGPRRAGQIDLSRSIRGQPGTGQYDGPRPNELPRNAAVRSYIRQAMGRRHAAGELVPLPKHSDETWLLRCGQGHEQFDREERRGEDRSAEPRVHAPRRGCS